METALKLGSCRETSTTFKHKQPKIILTAHDRTVTEQATDAKFRNRVNTLVNEAKAVGRFPLAHIADSMERTARARQAVNPQLVSAFKSASKSFGG
ncbi:hypothetical protein HR060_10695 [Catenovulum sp. SM1970]|uniref:hypothetical protein n=1 Tax=Marinifaba aquimaris TaxID=2741323 RepID=UPI0015737586|nr:hypothetical protein [Marinifaba aquimaris]NTS77332.1 hypothetical protein [Marinifaba aquimaris]